MTRAGISQKSFSKKQKNQYDVAKAPLTGPLVKHQLESKWYDYATDEKTNDNEEKQDWSNSEKEAEALYLRDVDFFNQAQRRVGGSESAWLATVLMKGTASDKTTALQLLVQKSPVHALAYISSLVSIVEKKQTREAFSVLGMLKDLFLNDLLPHQRKLIPFSRRPISRLKELSAGSRQNLERRLILWKFESDLKSIYERFVNAIEKLGGGTIENLCTRACRVALDLLAECPEQEQQLLSLLVNKLGHPNHRLATKVSGYLLQLTFRQPKMRGVVVNEVERLIYRKNVPGRTQLYAVSFLSQIQLRPGENSFAASLLKIYFGLFRMLVAKGKVEEKILSILLAATNRAYPFAEGQAEKLALEIDLLYKVLHQASFATAVQTLKLLSNLSGGNDSDRFYAALYRKMLDVNQSPLLQNQLLNLVCRVLKADMSTSRVIAFIKRLLQLSLTRSAAFAAGSLLVISQLTTERPHLLVLSKNSQKISLESPAKLPENWLDEDDEEFFTDVKEDFEIREVAGISGQQKKDSILAKEELQSNGGSWVHKKNIALRVSNNIYDPTARNPLYAKAEFSIASELLLLRDHYHPSVAVFAANLLEAGIPVRYDGDALKDFTPMRFLDRFVYRNPKTKNTSDAKSLTNVVRKRAYNPLGVKKLAVMSKEYMCKNRSEIPADERFLHRFATTSLKAKKEVNDEEQEFDEVGSVNSEEFDLLLDRFEPGEKNEVFEIDFAKEFSAEKKQRKAQKRVVSESDEDENDADNDDYAGDEISDDEELDDDSIGEEEDDEEDYDGVAESDVSDSDFGGKDDFHLSDDDNDSGSEFAEKLSYAEDAAISADKFDDLMEEEEEWNRTKQKSLKHRKFKKR